MERAFFIAIFIALLDVLAGCAIPSIPIKWKGQVLPDYHAHADILVAINGAEFDFNKAQYMDTPANEIETEAHMHDFNPRVLHFHSPAATLGDFFTGIGMSIDERCIDTGNAKYCSDGTHNLYVYVNGYPLFLKYNTYIPRDLDRIFIFYGNGVPSQAMINGVSRESCIYSKRCIPPVGFVLPDEGCT